MFIIRILLKGLYFNILKKREYISKWFDGINGLITTSVIYLMVNRGLCWKYYPSGFVAQLRGGFRQTNIRHIKPTVGRKVLHMFSVAQAQKKYS